MYITCIKVINIVFQKVVSEGGAGLLFFQYSKKENFREYGENRKCEIKVECESS